MDSMSDKEALVEYDYEAQHTDELTIRVGDVVTDLAPTEPGWMRGKLRGKVGVFPDNFVKMVHRDMAKPRPNPSEPAHTGSLKTNGVARRTQDASKRPGRRRCKALFSYTPDKADELALKLNDIIDVLEDVEPGWWKGSLNGKVGVFPSNFVEELPPLPADADVVQEIKPKPVKGVGLGDILRDAKSRPPPPQLPRPPDPTPAPQLPPKPVKELCRALFAYQRQNDDELTLKEGDIVTIVSKESDDKGWWRGELAGKIGVFPDNFVEIISSTEKPARPGKPPSKLATKTEAPQASGRPTSTGSDGAKTAAAQPPPAAGAAGDAEPTATMSQPTAAPAPSPAPAPAADPVPAQAPSPPPPLPKTPPPKQASPKPPPLSSKPATQSPASGAKPTAVPPTNPSDTTNSPVQTEVAPPAAAAPASVPDGPKKAQRPDGDTSLEEFDAVERSSERLTHITADRARAPGRRPTSTIFSRESMSPQAPSSPATPSEAPLAEEPDLVNGTADREPAAAAPTVSPTAQAAPPWMKELQRAQIKRHSRPVETDDEKTERQTSDASSAAATTSPEPAAATSPSAPVPSRPPWMCELQRAHSKKQSSRDKDDEKASGDTAPSSDQSDSAPAPPPVAQARPARPELPSEVKARRPVSARIAPKPADPPAVAPAAAVAPPRPAAPPAAAAPAPAPAAASDTRQLQEQVAQLQKQLADQSRQFTESLTALKADYTKRMRTVLDELDSEKKARLVMQVQLDRLDKLVKDMNFSSV
ncbi:SH3 domain-containing kinase-binding protein 1-like isoform X3 [Amphibalanus amphitrite]|uniref:SH3 domain-containing kinase-binding protein 1-like isoform X3 n=1 Tax=Amphibalanus amphitrite TaxID=1232801 RepID=UPI001C900186|nr:SH3 domain-containing kinase-binding protein 1-like isoform X3 [Amphibalanus amphitrite]XP_043204290.1 SH3 domain-containing kinase-binding protein 1-like isoform X3 [Amphibalanus amphitrite]XP_043205571.1 SH3 domain-containing kinase-binding protein 1-like isoform X3 [Amphibalanus amphitrite]XP_043205572.1 SH3 domain-containing kinase-binding protein 1-like isoform X3 [Amphibalanus amphitrite]XP_043205573.1 SH3 domain-containing kinase-binding protein 1-like isoform X3 [Amphibalanus amphitr